MNPLLFLSTLFLAGLFLAGCSDNPSPVDGSDKPCGIGPGLYANIAGTAEPVIMCVSDDVIDGTVEKGVHTLYSDLAGRYLISASFTQNNITHNLEISFIARDDIPAVLIVTADETLAQSNSDYIWFYCQITQGGGTFWTVSASGTITVTFNSPDIVVATFSGIELHLTDDVSQPASVVRTIPEGYINLTTDPY